MPEEIEIEGQEPEVHPDVFSREEMSKVRNEAKNYRLKLRETERLLEDLNAKVTKYEDAGKSELERMAGEKAELERALADKDAMIAEGAIRARVISEASKLDIVDIDAAYRLLDLTLIDEEPTSVKKALQALLKEKPYLSKPEGPPTPGVGGPPVSGAKSADDQMAEIMRSAVRRKNM